MKSLSKLCLISLYASVLLAASANADESKPLVISIEGEPAYNLFQHLNVEVTYGNHSTIKTGKNVTCEHTAFYPGDSDYTCELRVTSDGEVLITK